MTTLPIRQTIATIRRLTPSGTWTVYAAHVRSTSIRLPQPVPCGSGCEPCSPTRTTANLNEVA